jgi:hypothetical protein
MNARFSVSVAVLLGVAACGGGSTTTQTLEPPAIDALDPSFAITGSGELQLHISGTNFLPGSTVKWNGTPLQTTYVSELDLLAQVPAQLLSTSATVLIDVASPGNGGASSKAVKFSVEDPNPAPVLSSIDPAEAPSSVQNVPIQVTGSSFVHGATVYLGTLALQTSFVSSTELQAQIVGASPASAFVTVVNPAPGGGTSQGLLFQFVNPAPVISAVSPTSAVAGTSVNLTVDGTGFIQGSWVEWNGQRLNTSPYSSTQLSVSVPSTLVTAGTIQVTVSSPPPGGGRSNAMPFTVTAVPPGYPMVVLSIPANDLVWDPVSSRIYASVPSTAATHGNTVAVVDPDAGVLVNAQFAGSEPSRIAVSDDGQFLYVGLDGAASVKRFHLPDLTPGITMALGSDSFFGPWHALDLQVAPAHAGTTAVSLGSSGSSPSALGGVVIYDDATARPTRAPGFGGGGNLFDSIQWGTDAAHIYAGNAEDTGFDFYVLTVDSSGVSLAHDYGGALGGFGARIHFDRGTQLVYGDDGQVLDPSTGQPAGHFQASGLMVPDSTVGRAFFLGSSSFNSPDYVITTYDLLHFTSIGSVTLKGVAGTPRSFIRWGPRGLAFCTDQGVYLVAGGFVDGSG